MIEIKPTQNWKTLPDYSKPRPSQESCFMLYLQKLPLEEIAAQLNLSPNTVKQYIIGFRQLMVTIEGVAEKIKAYNRGIDNQIINALIEQKYLD
jgi:hypothetical protein